MKSSTKALIEYEVGGGTSLKSFIIDFIAPNSFSFQKLLRIIESFDKHSGVKYKVIDLLYRRASILTGITIPPHVCDRGLTLYHYGSIVVNESARIGKNCCIMNNVNIGANGGSDKAPIIGNDVYIGPGAVIYGDIHIADGCYIGANAVVNKSIFEPHSVVVGAPAKVIKTDKEVWWKKNRLNRE